MYLAQTQLELSSENQKALLSADLTSTDGLRDVTTAAKELQAVMNAEIHPALVQLTAVQDQKKSFDRWKSKFSHTLSRHFNNLFIHMVSAKFQLLYLFLQYIIEHLLVL